MPRSSALWTTLRVAARSMRPPKLLQPRPTTDTRRPDFPRLRCSIRSSGGEGREYFVECRQLAAVDRIGDEDRGVEARSVPRGELVAYFRGRAAERVVGDPAVRQIARNVVASVLGEGLLDRRHLLTVAGFLPIIAVVRQEHIAFESAAMQRQRGAFVLGDADRQHVAD